jgi:hypothetical protein
VKPNPPENGTNTNTTSHKTTDPGKTGPETTDPGKTNSKTVVTPPPPVPRDFVIVLTGDLPDKDEDVSFDGAADKPKVRREAGKLEFTFSLLPDSPKPKPVVDAKRFTVQPRTSDAGRAEFALARVLPPASVRLKGLDAVPDKSALTIGGRPGVEAGGALLFKQAAEADGKFHLDAACWQLSGQPKEVQPGVWEAEMVLNMYDVAFTVPASGNPWRSVTFTPVNPRVLPPLKSLAGLGQYGSASETNLTFTLESDEPEPAPLPAGDYTVSWLPAVLTAPALDGGRFTVRAGQENVLALPAR